MITASPTVVSIRAGNGDCDCKQYDHRPRRRIIADEFLETRECGLRVRNPHAMIRTRSRRLETVAEQHATTGVRSR
ncbi:hypothetical protein [Natrialba sp. INN-245]|uniref:hypothetical protein n=1 Tax=Natrialba sp. INN-245 TaxID=2690967 RepID=UPI0013131A9D|nr:hypothetical protein [Natrialba sp. INN-245]MWV39697.1 hypothetical protein [Natrialba sp. INN-245]